MCCLSICMDVKLCRCCTTAKMSHVFLYVYTHNDDGVKKCKLHSHNLLSTHSIWYNCSYRPLMSLGIVKLYWDELILDLFVLLPTAAAADFSCPTSCTSCIAAATAAKPVSSLLASFSLGTLLLDADVSCVGVVQNIKIEVSPFLSRFFLNLSHACITAFNLYCRSLP